MRAGGLVFVLLCAAPAAAEVVYFEDFEDQAHDLALGGGAGHTIGGGVATQSYGVEPDGGGYDLEMRLDLLSLASDEGSGGSYVWPGARIDVPALSDDAFSISAELTIDEAFAGGADQSLSVGLVARCSYLFDPDHCAGLDSNLLSLHYRLSYAIAGSGSFIGAGAPLEAGQLRLVERNGDGQVDVTVPGIAPPLGAPFEMRLEGTVVPGGLAIVGRMRNGASEAVVEGFDPTPLTGPGFGIRTGGSVEGLGGADVTGALDVDVDDVTIAPEPDSPAMALAALLALVAGGLRSGRSSPRPSP
ncbi:MAG: hypothetical protein OZ948_13400 [Deltaproteobacteria bacterium]|nr:hypothetical protein [Deltaproteobacteria bacterium]